MPGFELAQAGFIFPILEGLKNSDVTLTKIKRQSGLHKFKLDSTESYIPVLTLYNFFEALRKSEGLDNPHVLFANDIQLVSLSAWGEMVAFAPDLISSIKLAIKYQGVVLTNEVLRLDISGTRATFLRSFTDPFYKGKVQVDYVNFMFMLNGFRLSLGADWDPLEVHFQSDDELDLTGILQPGSLTKVHHGQKHTAITFSTELLGRPMLNKESSKIIKPPVSFQSKVEALIDSVQIIPCLESIAVLVNEKPRTFQRRLSEEDNSFSKILDNWRFKKSIDLLGDERLKLQEISERLHYNDVSNFERAFRRWANTTPGVYRNTKLA